MVIRERKMAVEPDPQSYPDMPVIIPTSNKVGVNAAVTKPVPDLLQGGVQSNMISDTFPHEPNYNFRPYASPVYTGGYAGEPTELNVTNNVADDQPADIQMTDANEEKEDLPSTDDVKRSAQQK